MQLTRDATGSEIDSQAVQLRGSISRHQDIPVLIRSYSSFILCSSTFISCHYHWTVSLLLSLQTPDFRQLPSHHTSRSRTAGIAASCKLTLASHTGHNCLAACSLMRSMIMNNLNACSLKRQVCSWDKLRWGTRDKSYNQTGCMNRTPSSSLESDFAHISETRAFFMVSQE
jgi:hypothetical protein